MESRIHAIITLLLIPTLAACSLAGERSTPVPPGANPYAAQPGDGNMMRNDVRIDSADVVLAESYPPQVMLHLKYFQPTPCHQLRIQTSPPDAQNQIQITAYAVAEKDKPCTLMALATPLEANLNLGSFPKGHYTVWLNGSKVGEFDS